MHAWASTHPTPSARETDGSKPYPSARPLSSGDIDIACFRYKRSIFFDVPEDEGIRLEHPRDILAPQKRLLELARQPRILFDAIGGGGAEPGFGRSQKR